MAIEWESLEPSPGHERRKEGSMMVGLDPAKDHSEVLRTYRVYRKMNQYPSLVGLMRSLLVEVLEQKGVVTRERLLEQARE